MSPTPCPLSFLCGSTQGIGTNQPGGAKGPFLSPPKDPIKHLLPSTYIPPQGHDERVRRTQRGVVWRFSPPIPRPSVRSSRPSFLTRSTSRLCCAATPTGPRAPPRRRYCCRPRPPPRRLLPRPPPARLFLLLPRHNRRRRRLHDLWWRRRLPPPKRSLLHQIPGPLSCHRRPAAAAA